MQLILVTGGARSGKSAFAEGVAATRGGGEVTYLATAAAGDDEMARRIRRHRERRPADWITREAQLEVGGALLAAPSAVVLLDCLSLLAANVLLSAEARGEEAAIGAVLDETERLLDAARSRDGTLIVVTNEVGLGVVPGHALGRWYRDALGLANQRVAAEAGQVVLTVSGIPLAVKGTLPPTTA
jgi:adenosylcobinamide kinase / adenosylcobinamide-phosphate guanylyltransferase